MFLVAIVVITLILESVQAWIQWWRGQQTQQPRIAWQDGTRSDWTRFGEQTTVVLSAMWFVLMVVSKLLPQASTQQVTLNTTGLISHVILSGGITLMLAAVMLSSRRPPVEFGLRWIPIRPQIRDGVYGFLLSVLPMIGTVLLTAPLRTRDTQNPLLTFMSDTGSPLDIVLICLLAVVIAPLSEELMFRVILQGWLSTVVRPALAVPIVVAAFAAIHGLTDGIALVPLAAVLGYVFYRRHSYVSVVVIHALFNATMLILQILTQPTSEIVKH